MPTIRWILGAVLAVALVACSDDVTGPDGPLDAVASASFSRRLDVGTARRFRLEGVSGTITIQGDATSTDVRVEGTRAVWSDSESDAEAYLSRVSVGYEQDEDAIVIRTIQPSDTGGRTVLVDYDLLLPRDLDVQIEAVNGDVEVRTVDGAVDVEHVNGSVYVSGTPDGLEASLVNGDVGADVSLAMGGTARLSVVNGTVALGVPVATSAMLEARVVNGTVGLQGLTLHDAITTTRSIQGRLGDGEGLIDLDGVNATIIVRGR